MTPFRSTPEGYAARWQPVERTVLARVARDVAELVRAESGIGPGLTLGEGVAFTGVVRVPHDPAVQRLLPDAHREDPDVAADFRHLTQTDLAAAKVARLEAFADALDGDFDDPDADGLDADPEVVEDLGGAPTVLLVRREEAQDFAGALTDLRLVLAERLGLDDDEDVELLHDEVVANTWEDDDTEDASGADAVDEADASDDVRVDVGGEQRRYWGGVFLAAGLAQESLVDEMLADLRAGRADG
jgi:hypothetical protein